MFLSSSLEQVKVLLLLSCVFLFGGRRTCNGVGAPLSGWLRAGSGGLQSHCRGSVCRQLFSGPTLCSSWVPMTSEDAGLETARWETPWRLSAPGRSLEVSL